MPEETTPDAEAPQEPTTVEQMLSALPEDHRAVVLKQLQDARSDAAKYRVRAKELEPVALEAQKLKEAQMSAEQRAQEAADAANKRADAFQVRAVNAEVRSFASGQFADPEDALAFIDAAKYVDSSGEIDTSALQTDLTALLERKPHLAAVAPPAQAARTNVVAPDRAQGSSASPAASGTPISNSQIFADFWNSTS